MGCRPSRLHKEILPKKEAWGFYPFPFLTIRKISFILTTALCKDGQTERRHLIEKRILSFVKEKTNELINAPTCSGETKAAAQAWFDALGTAGEGEETKKYIAELEADIMPIDNLIAFAGSPAGAQYFGEKTAKGIVAHCQEIKAAGAKYCDCPACAAVAAILEKKDAMLAK